MILTKTYNFYQWLHYEDGLGTATPCWNGNISAMEWESLDALLATQPARHSYAYTYDGLNRLTAAAHEAVDYDEWSNLLMMSNEPDYSCTYGYDLNGNITSLNRHGVNIKVNVFNNDAWHFGEIDHLSMTYDGNRLRKVTDQCAELTYAGAMDFKDGIDQTEEYLWDDNGNMTRDRNKGIYEISYNVLNLPERIRYYDGHEVRYTYAADGRKLHVDYLLNLFPIIDDEWGSDPEPQPFPDPNSTGNLLGSGDSPNGHIGGGPIEPIQPQVLMTRDWCGSHVYRNGALERIENEYGYWADSCYHYRIADYQGNVRAVISQNGVLEEVNGYYPYGGITGAPATGVQPLKYGGKELDRENGLDWLDFEARMYDPMLPQFRSIDRKCEDYPETSPFTYCAGNPIRYTDPTGMNPVYDRNGIYLGDTSEGFTGEVLVMRDGYAGEIDVSKMTSEELQEKFYAFTLDDQQHYCDPLSGDALSNIWTNILSHFEGISINGEVFTLNRIKNGRVGFSEQDPSDPYAFNTDISGSLPLITGTGDNYLAFENTVENLADALLNHEWYGHGVKHYGNRTETHHKVYESQIKTMLFHKTTDRYKEYILNNYLMFILKEVINK